MEVMSSLNGYNLQSMTGYGGVRPDPRTYNKQAIVSLSHKIERTKSHELTVSLLPGTRYVDMVIGVIAEKTFNDLFGRQDILSGASKIV